MARQHHDGAQAAFGSVLQVQPAAVQHGRVSHDRQLVTEQTAITFAVMLVGGVLASLMAVWHALRTPAQLALGG